MKRERASDPSHPRGRTEAASASSMLAFVPAQINMRALLAPRFNDVCLLKLCCYDDLPPAAVTIC